MHATVIDAGDPQQTERIVKDKNRVQVGCVADCVCSCHLVIKTSRKWRLQRHSLMCNERKEAAVDLTLILLNILTEAVAEVVICWRRRGGRGGLQVEFSLCFHPVNFSR